MPNVPERKLSYGELLDQLKQADKWGRRRKDLAKWRKHENKRKQPRKSAPRHEYSYNDVVKRIKDINSQEY